MKCMPGYNLLVAFALLGTAGGCAASTPSAPPGADLRLQLGQSADVDGRAFEIHFEAVVADSRCPKGETCVWEGDAIVRLSVKGAAGAEARLELHTASKGPASAGYDGWSIQLVALEPYPVTGRTILQAAYAVTLRVTRGAVAGDAIQ